MILLALGHGLVVSARVDPRLLPQQRLIKGLFESCKASIYTLDYYVYVVQHRPLVIHGFAAELLSTYRTSSCDTKLQNE